jgi:hypothetical protein
MSGFRPLAPRPSLEFDRKAAKALLRSLKAHDPAAVARARAHFPSLDLSYPAGTKLADAQHIIAREYGFASWPRLVQYYTGVEQQRYARSPYGPQGSYERNVQGLLAAHASGNEVVGRALAAYVPRFYGMRVDEVFAMSVTEDEARLTVARIACCPSWEVLLEPKTTELQLEPEDPWIASPVQRAVEAIRRADLAALQQIVRQYPALRGGKEAFGARRGFSLLRIAHGVEAELGRDALEPIRSWLAARGEDLQCDLNEALCFRGRIEPEEVRSLLEEGADASWVAPDGIPVLEHALLRYWNGDAVDVLASRTVPRKALWIAAGLGDVAGVRGFLDRHGKPTQAARRRRPPFDAVQPSTMPPSLPDPDDDEILFEAFWIAVLNGRANVIEYMVSRGFDVDHLLAGNPVSYWVAINCMASSLAALVRSGADLDLRGVSQRSAREAVREQLLNGAHDERYWLPVAKICGLDPAAILAEYNATPRAEPALAPDVMQAIALAGDDALRQGETQVRAENLMYGLLRASPMAVYCCTHARGIDREQFATQVMPRVRPDHDAAPPSSYPQHADVAAVLAAAKQLAAERRREMVTGAHVLSVLLRDKHGAAATLIERFGGSVSTTQEDLSSGL